MEVEVLRHPTDEDWRAVKARALFTIGKSKAKELNAEVRNGR